MKWLGLLVSAALVSAAIVTPVQDQKQRNETQSSLILPETRTTEGKKEDGNLGFNPQPSNIIVGQQNIPFSGPLNGQNQWISWEVNGVEPDRWNHPHPHGNGFPNQNGQMSGWANSNGHHRRHHRHHSNNRDGFNRNGFNSGRHGGHRNRHQRPGCDKSLQTDANFVRDHPQEDSNCEILFMVIFQILTPFLLLFCCACCCAKCIAKSQARRNAPAMVYPVRYNYQMPQQTIQNQIRYHEQEIRRLNQLAPQVQYQQVQPQQNIGMQREVYPGAEPSRRNPQMMYPQYIAFQDQMSHNESGIPMGRPVRREEFDY